MPQVYTSFDNIGLRKVLIFLKSHKFEYISGQDLSQVLKISRVAVWKHIKKIRELGYKIESKQNQGYKLTKDTDLLLPWEITDGLTTKSIGRRVYFFDTIDSTQNFAIKIAATTQEDGTVIIAQKQTHGKGRLGRKWISPKGGIFLSIILEPKFDMEQSTILPLATSVAISCAIEKILNLRPKLKWPNDITLDGKKVAGILIDASLESNKMQNLVIGVGINFKINSKKISKIFKNTTNFYGAASLVKESHPVDTKIFVQTFLQELEDIIDLINDGKTDDVIKQWIKRTETLGRTIKIHTQDGIITGKAIKIDDDGALIIRQKKSQKRILVGDIQYVR